MLAKGIALSISEGSGVRFTAPNQKKCILPIINLMRFSYVYLNFCSTLITIVVQNINESSRRDVLYIWQDLLQLAIRNMAFQLQHIVENKDKYM